MRFAIYCGWFPWGSDRSVWRLDNKRFITHRGDIFSATVTSTGDETFEI